MPISLPRVRPSKDPPILLAFLANGVAKMMEALFFVLTRS